MLRQLANWLSELTPRGLFFSVCSLTIAMELLTLLFRFGFSLESTRDTGFLSAWTFGIRIHHGYIGLLLLLAAGLRPQPRIWRNLAIILGASLALSDFIQHFLVLWPITGSPEFDLVYPKSNVLPDAANP